MSGNTLLPPKKQLVDTSGDICTSDEASHIFGKAAAKSLAKDLADMVVGNENEDDYDASAELYSDASKHIVTSNLSERSNAGSKLFPIDTTQSPELFPDNSKDTSTGSDNKNIMEKTLTEVNISLTYGNTFDNTGEEETSQGDSKDDGDLKEDRNEGDSNDDGDSKEDEVGGTNKEDIKEKAVTEVVTPPLK